MSKLYKEVYQAMMNLTIKLKEFWCYHLKSIDFNVGKHIQNTTIFDFVELILRCLCKHPSIIKPILNINPIAKCR